MVNIGFKVDNVVEHMNGNLMLFMKFDAIYETFTITQTMILFSCTYHSINVSGTVS